MAALGRSFFGRFFGRTIGEGAAFALGTAAGPALRPAVQELANAAWSHHAVRPPDAYTLAEGVAQGQVDPARAHEWAAEQGIGSEQFAALVSIANVGPGVASAFDLWRRNAINEAGFRRAVKRLGLEQEWIDDLVTLKTLRLAPAEVANAVQQGHLPPGDILPPPVSGSPPYSIPLTEVALDPLAEAAAHGVDEPRLRVLANLAGLPPGDMELLAMWNRGIIDEESVEAGIREGHRKTKWIPAVKQLRHAVLSAVVYAELHLRGWIGAPQMYQGGALTGYSTEEMDLLFKVHGRPATTRQVFIGLRRGGSYDGPLAGIDPAFVTAVKQSNIRPEWTNLLWSQRYTYPTAFVLRALTQAGDLSETEAEKILLFQGWEPTLAKQVSTKWAAGGGAATKELTKAELLAEFEGYYITEGEFRERLALLGYPPAVQELEVELGNARRVKGERDRVLTATFKHYTKHEISREDASGRLDALRIPVEARDNILAVWDVEAVVNPAKLTRSEIKRAYIANRLTRDQAVARLEDLGYSEADAIAYLDS